MRENSKIHFIPPIPKREEKVAFIAVSVRTVQNNYKA